MARRTAPPAPFLDANSGLPVSSSKRTYSHACKLPDIRVVARALHLQGPPALRLRGRRLGEEGDASRRSEETSVQYAHSTDATFLKPLRGTNTSLMFSTKAASRKTALMAVWQALAQAS